MALKPNLNDAQGNCLSIRSARAVLANSQAVTAFTYDRPGRLTGELSPRGHGVSCDYEILDQRISKTDAYGAQTGFSYEALGRLTLIDYPSPDVVASFGKAAYQYIDFSLADFSGNRYFLHMACNGQNSPW